MSADAVVPLLPFHSDPGLTSSFSTVGFQLLYSTFELAEFLSIKNGKNAELRFLPCAMNLYLYP